MAGVPNDVTVLATNIAVFAAAIAAAVAGSLGAIKVIKSKFLEIFDKDGQNATGKTIAGGYLLDNTSLILWSESMRDLREALDENTREQRELRHAMEMARVARERR